MKTIKADLDRIKKALWDNSYIPEDLEKMKAELENINKALNELYEGKLEKAREMEKPIPKSLDREIVEIEIERGKANILINYIKGIIRGPIPRSADLYCTNAEVIMYAFKGLGFAAEISEYEGIILGNYCSTPILLTNANEKELSEILPNWHEDGFDEDKYYEKYLEFFYYERFGLDRFSFPIPLGETAPDSYEYYFPGENNHIIIKTNQPMKGTENNENT